MGIPDFWIKLLKEYSDEAWNIHLIWQVLNDRLPHVKTVAYAESHDQALVGDKTLAFRLMDKEMYWHMQKDDPDLIIDRGMALHKMIRLFTIALGGQAYMTFMGNEFGHPEWIDFPREGNGWSYKHCRRQWSLVDNKDLKYQYLDTFDKAMIRVIKDHRIMTSLFGNQLNMDDGNKTIVFERNHLVFLFNFHTSNSIPDYRFPVPRPGEYEIILNSDDRDFGGHGRIDNTIRYTSFNEGRTPFISLYNTNRTALVLKRVV
jgi:1,4-alpha-glucan branching enzyme